MQFQRLRVTSLIALAAVLGACGGDSSQPQPPSVASVRVSPESPSIAAGATVQLQAVALDEDGQPISGKTATWSSSASAVAEVSGTGLVTGRTAGAAQILATIDGRTGSTTVTVTPPPVATVSIDPPSPSVEAGSTLQLSAVLRAADNTVLAGRTVTWTSATPSVATVGASSGLVTGVNPGTTQITATSEGKSAQVTLTVTTAGGTTSVAITSVQPAQLREGDEATITGEGFSTAGANTVMIDGERATVLEASATSLRITVPRACMPARQASLSVTVTGAGTAVVQHPALPAETLDMDAGEFRLLSDPANLCLQLPATANASEYVFGVQSTGSSGIVLTPVTVRADAATGAQALSSVARPIAPLSARTFAASSPAQPQTLPAVDQRFMQHRAAHARLQRLEDRNITPLLQSARRAGNTLSLTSSSAANIPANPQIGDTVDVRILDISQSRCDAFAAIKTVVRHISTRGIFLDDVGNPASGFQTADYQKLGTLLDEKIYATDADYFGAPGDIDGNTRIAIVFSKEVNKSPALGFVTSADLLTVGQCAVSNEGEVYYSRAPDPDGLYGNPYALADALTDMPPVLAHELTHIIQNSRRTTFPGATIDMARWEKESQAMIAEEVVGHAVNGYAPRQNLSLGVALNSNDLHEYAFYYSNFVGLALYFGLINAETKAQNAPEQCTFLADESQGYTGPCITDLALYTGWSFLRWISDHYGPSLGGEQQLHRRMIDNTTQGFETLANLTGTSIDELLTRWAASLWLDDRHAGLDPLVTLPSWNLFQLNTGLNPVHGRLQPRERTWSDFTDNLSIRAPSAAYYRISGQTRPATAIRVTSQSGAALPGFMRVWVVRVQ